MIRSVFLKDYSSHSVKDSEEEKYTEPENVRHKASAGGRAIIELTA